MNFLNIKNAGKGHWNMLLLLLKIIQFYIKDFRSIILLIQFWNIYLGVRALLIDKDNRPAWKPSKLSEVSEERIKYYFSKLSPENELVFD